MAVSGAESDLREPTPMLARVVGIDPGLNVTGYAVLEPSPSGPMVVEAGVIRPRATRAGLGQRLVWIHEGIVEILKAFPPGSVALEQVHSHISHPRTAILMAHARAIVLAAAQHRMPVFGYAPTQIKKTLTGNGRAPKTQIQHAIMIELGLDRLPEPNDVADACAVAVPFPYEPELAGLRDWPRIIVGLRSAKERSLAERGPTLREVIHGPFLRGPLVPRPTEAPMEAA